MNLCDFRTDKCHSGLIAAGGWPRARLVETGKFSEDFCISKAKDSTWKTTVLVRPRIVRGRLLY